MTLHFRRRMAWGPLWLSLGRRSASVSLAAGPASYSPARRRLTVRLGGGWTWSTLLGRRSQHAEADQ